jgi:hypothetical protein
MITRRYLARRHPDDENTVLPKWAQMIESTQWLEDVHSYLTSGEKEI